MIITEKDIGRKVIDGYGNVETIIGFDYGHYGDGHPVKTGTSSYLTSGRWNGGDAYDSLLDLVRFVDEPKFVITEKDIGRKVANGKGDIETIVYFVPTDAYPVKTSASSSYTSTGVWSIGLQNWFPYNLVRFVDDTQFVNDPHLAPCVDEKTGKVLWSYVPDGIPDLFTKGKEGKVEAVDHPTHYNTGNIEVIDVILDWGLDFTRGNVVKYVSRAAHKGKELEDLKKASWYLNRAIEELEKK